MHRKKTNSIPAISQKGFSLVELMVAVVIGLLTTLAVLQVFVSFEEQKRVSTGGAESLEHGAIGINILSTQIGQAGFGMMIPTTLDCRTYATDEPKRDASGVLLDPAATDQDYMFRLRPITITQGALNAPDQISVAYGTSPMILGGVKLVGEYDGTEADLLVADTYGFAPRDRIIIAQPMLSTDTTRHDCSLREVTRVITVPTFILEHDSRYDYRPDEDPDVIPNFSEKNKAGGNTRPDGTKISFNTSAKVFNFGTLVSPVYSVQNNTLIAGTTTTNGDPLIDNVVTLQAQYGFDTRAPNTRADTLVVNQYSEVFLDADGDNIGGELPTSNQDTSFSDPDDWESLGAIRIALVVRTSQAEIPEEAKSDSALCTATTTPTITFPWSYKDASGNDQTSLTINITGGRTDWRCYRYKSYETVVALRNIKWSLPR